MTVIATSIRDNIRNEIFIESALTDIILGHSAKMTDNWYALYTTMRGREYTSFAHIHFEIHRSTEKLNTNVL